MKAGDPSTAKLGASCYDSRVCAAQSTGLPCAEASRSIVVSIQIVSRRGRQNLTIGERSATVAELLTVENVL